MKTKPQLIVLAVSCFLAGLLACCYLMRQRQSKPAPVLSVAFPRLAPVATPTSLPVSYSAASPESLERLTIGRIALDDTVAARIVTLSRTNSPWGSRWVTCEPADMMHDGPWT